MRGHAPCTKVSRSRHFGISFDKATPPAGRRMAAMFALTCGMEGANQTFTILVGANVGRRTGPISAARGAADGLAHRRVERASDRVARERSATEPEALAIEALEVVAVALLAG